MSMTEEVEELITQNLSPATVLKFHGARYMVEEVPFCQYVGGIRLVHHDPELAQYWAAGYVRKVGDGHDGKEQIKMVFSEGDLIFFERLVGRQVQLSGRKYRVVPQTSVFGNFDLSVISQEKNA